MSRPWLHYQDGIPVKRANRKLHRDRQATVGGWEGLLAEVGDFGSGEQRLWAAVLEQALREAREAMPEEWLEGEWPEAPEGGWVEVPRWWKSVERIEWFREAQDGPGGFEWVCGVLGLPVKEVREWALG